MGHPMGYSICPLGGFGLGADPPVGGIALDLELTCPWRHREYGLPVRSYMGIAYLHIQGSV